MEDRNFNIHRVDRHNYNIQIKFELKKAALRRRKKGVGKEPCQVFVCCTGCPGAQCSFRVLTNVQLKKSSLLIFEV